MYKTLLYHNCQCYPSGLVLMLASSLDEEAEVLNEFIVRMSISTPYPFYVTEVDH